MPVTVTPREVVEDYLARLSRRDESAFDLVAVDVVRHQAAVQGRNGVRESAYAIDADLGGPEIVIHHVVASDDLVCVHLDLVGTHVGSTMPLLSRIVPGGRKVTWSFLHLFRVVDGLLTEHWACHDDLGLLEQLGLGFDKISA
ncbi:lactoylglutathione lyase [Nakamurella sp. UYEF19]|uniref:ester cyclase n=1 Tax=Nakamurella sp. UYEF19 TaxID=1756392 RepID=UPI003398B269